VLCRGLSYIAFMINPDELEPQRKPAQKRDLTPMSVGELQNYIAELEMEIGRAEEAIAKKEAHKSGADALFGGRKE
jgi:uncharacterized small protein (DUF1192 family)